MRTEGEHFFTSKQEGSSHTPKPLSFLDFTPTIPTSEELVNAQLETYYKANKKRLNEMIKDIEEMINEAKSTGLTHIVYPKNGSDILFANWMCAMIMQKIFESYGYRVFKSESSAYSGKSCLELSWSHLIYQKK